MNDKELLKQRIKELYMRADKRNYEVFTEFLNLDEISILKSELYECDYVLYGGYENSERCVAGFGTKETSVFPISCIEISPLQQKFSDKLNHRDFLGSLMNLGIERDTLGDIKIIDNVGYLFCLDSIAEYIVDSLTRIKHTSVKCKIIDNAPEIVDEEPEETAVIVSSLRLDTIVAGVYNLSRSASSLLIKQEKVFINSRSTTKDSVQLKSGDVVSVRGHGKFIYCDVSHNTKKGKNVIIIKKY